MSGSTKIALIAATIFFFLPIIVVIAGVGGVAAALLGDSTTADTGVSAIDCPAATTSGGLAGYQTDQLTNAATIVAVGKQMNVPEQGWVVAIAAAMQESGLRNLDYGDRDSLGLFQQRPSQGWGTPAQIINPSYATTQFYRHLLAVPGWQQMSVNDAAQTVQRSGFPDAYAQHEEAAREIIAAASGATCTTSGPATSSLTPSAATMPSVPDAEAHSNPPANTTRMSRTVATVSAAVVGRQEATWRDDRCFGKHRCY